MNGLDSTPVLAGDVGGTKTHLAVAEVSGNQVSVLAEEVYSSREWASLHEILQAFLSAHDAPVAAACFGVAGPVRDNVANTTNLPWHIDANDLAAQFPIGRVSLLNDLEANAWGIQALEPDDFYELYAGEAGATGKSTGNGAVIAAGTGLGEAGMYFDGERLRPFATEGGHTDFSPCSELEIELLRYLRKQYHHVSWERVLAGPGLVHIHDFLRAQRGVLIPDWLMEEMRTGDPAAAISEAAQARKDDICEEALSLFVRLYGAEAGNLALKHMATGGVYVGGGIAPKILDWLKQGEFVQAFLDKGRMRPLLEQMPVRVILNDRTALFGPAVFAAR